jgi:hypothetical protein
MADGAEFFCAKLSIHRIRSSETYFCPNLGRQTGRGWTEGRKKMQTAVYLALNAVKWTVGLGRGSESQRLFSFIYFGRPQVWRQASPLVGEDLNSVIELLPNNFGRAFAGTRRAHKQRPSLPWTAEEAIRRIVLSIHSFDGAVLFKGSTTTMSENDGWMGFWVLGHAAVGPSEGQKRARCSFCVAFFILLKWQSVE